MTLGRLALAAAFAVATAPVSAQQAAPFRGGVEIVYLDLTVTAANGSIVTGLTKDDFEIFDEGVRHEVAVFSDQPEPISLGILIDTSNSMTADRIKAAIGAADAMGRALQSKDLWSVFSFSTRLNQLIGWRPYDSSAIKCLGPQALRSGEVLVYGLGIRWAQSGGGNSDLHVPSLEKLVNPTGGSVAVARTMPELEILAKRLTDELRQQYTVGFTPLKAPDGKYRRLKVVAKNPAYPVRTRAGYPAKKP